MSFVKNIEGWLGVAIMYGRVRWLAVEIMYERYKGVLEGSLREICVVVRSRWRSRV